MTVPLQSESGTDRIIGTGPMHDMVRAFDWGASPLGDIDTWSEALVTMVNHVLRAPLPAVLVWGDDFITFYNEAAIATMGTRHPEAFGLSYRKVYGADWDRVGPELEACYRTGRTAVHENLRTIDTHEEHPQERFWTFSRVPILDRGVISGVLIPHRDTTSAVLAARERDAVNLQMAQFLGATKDSVVGVNRDWRITYLNHAAELTYGSSASLVGRNLWEAFPEAVYPGSPYVEMYERAMSVGTPGSFEAHYPAPLNIWIQLEVYATPDGIVTFSRDISERRRTEAALMQTEKLAAVGRMASSIAHEINNPLEAVTNLLYIARHSYDAAEVREMLELADAELRRVAVIANGTLRFHRQSSRPMEVSSQNLFHAVLTMYEGKLRNAAIAVERRKRSTVPVRVYEGDIRQVLNNVIGNAIDAMPLGGRMVLRCREATHWPTGRSGLTLTVADSGSGIPPEVLARVFEAFYTTKGIHGSGLGLWISRDIVARHEGSLRIRSSQDAKHRGTVVTLFLPFHAEIKAAATPALHA